MLSNITEGLLFHCPIRRGQVVFVERARGNGRRRPDGTLRHSGMPASDRLDGQTCLVLDKAAKLLGRSARKGGLVEDLPMVFPHEKDKIVLCLRQSGNIGIGKI